ncbi:MAG TPA: hypothetical protein VGC94_02020 [Amnibacterium sp.]
MSDARPILPLTLLGGFAPACEGDECLVPATGSVGDSSTGAAAAG